MENTLKIKKQHSMPPMLVVLLGFLAVMLVGALLISLPISNTDGKWMSFTHAIFWATNGVCGTGLIVSPTALSLTGFGQAVLFLLIQFGGLGFMTFATFVFILIRKRITLRDRIAIKEALGQDQMKGVVRLVLSIAITTGIIELAGTILLIPFFCVKNGAIGIWQALFNSISAFCNAGFDVMATITNPYGSLSDYNANAGVLLIIATLSILGSLGFPVINDLVKCRFKLKKCNMHTKIVLITALSLMTFGTFFIFICEFNSQAFAGMSGGQKLLNGMFQAVMASSTAGFSSIDQTALTSTGKAFTTMLMFIGASPCSTGGGIKTSTFAVLILMAAAGLRGKEEITVKMRTIPYHTAMRAVAVTLLSAACVLTGVLILSATDPAVATGYNYFECMTAFTTTGLSMGTAPIYSKGALYTLSVLMLIGRIGPLSVGTIFVREAKKTSLKYPNINIMIG